MSVEAESAETTYSPFHMLASALGTCTLSVLHAWAANAKLPGEAVAVEVGWSFAENPHHVDAMEVAIDWPGLPPERLAAAERVADLCTIKKTLNNPPPVRTHVRTGAGGA